MTCRVHRAYRPGMSSAPICRSPWPALGLLVLALSASACDEQASPEASERPSEVAAAGGGSDPAAARSGSSEEANPYGFEPWFDDYPIAFEQPPRDPRTYDRTAGAALRSVLEKVSGETTRESWLFAKRFVGRLDSEALEIANEVLAGALSNPERAVHAENLIESLGATGLPEAGRAIMRAFKHPEPAVRNKAMAALVQCGDAAMVREALQPTGGLPAEATLSWAKAAVAHLPPQEAVGYLRPLVEDPSMRRFLDYLIDIVDGLPPEYALQTFEGYVDVDLQLTRLPLAAWRHAAGMPTGTAELRALMNSVDAGVRAQAIGAVSTRAPERMFDALLERLEQDAAPEVRIAAIEALSRIEDPEQRSIVDLALETRSYDPNVGVRRAALQALVDRGQPQELDQLLVDVRVGTGTRKLNAIEDLIAARYAPAIPVLAERMLSEEGEARRGYLRAMCLMRIPAAIEPARDAFFSSWIDPTTIHDLGIWMSNLPEVELVVLEMFADTPEDDYVRRSVLLNTLGNMAADPDRTDDDFRGPIQDLYWQLIEDDSVVPQLRVQALGQLRRDLEIRDLRRLRRVIVTTGDRRFAAYLNSFLFEYF